MFLAAKALASIAAIMSVGSALETDEVGLDGVRLSFGAGLKLAPPLFIEAIKAL